MFSVTVGSDLGNIIPKQRDSSSLQMNSTEAVKLTEIKCSKTCLYSGSDYFNSWITQTVEWWNKKVQFLHPILFREIIMLNLFALILIIVSTLNSNFWMDSSSKVFRAVYRHLPHLVYMHEAYFKLSEHRLGVACTAAGGQQAWAIVSKLRVW